MKAISLWQPWASLMAVGVKRYETRDWRGSYKGAIFVHAAKRIIKDPDDDLNRILEVEFGKYWRDRLPLGALLSVHDLMGFISTTNSNANHTEKVCGNWSPDRWAWEMPVLHYFRLPIPYKGEQGLFNVPDDLLCGLKVKINERLI